MPRRRAYGAYASSGQPQTPHQSHDFASIFGLPAESMAPEIIGAVQQMLNEAGDLRGQLAAAEHHRRHLEDQADLYPGLGCLNAHAFIRELDAFLAATSWQAEQIMGQLAVIHVGGLDLAVGLYGMDCGDQALRCLWERLRSQAMAGEPIAYLGFGLFCWLMIDPEAAQAEHRLTGAAQSLRQVPPLWREIPLLLSISTGLAPLIPEQGIVQTLRQADCNRTSPSPA
jgi:GGDEF domain-containing protein